jgi:hypothetical protein
MGNCSSCCSASPDPPSPDTNHDIVPPSASRVVPVPGAANHDDGVTVSQPPDYTVATPVDTSQGRETMPLPGSPLHSGEKRPSLPSRPRGQDLQSSLSMDRGTMMTTRQRQIDSMANVSTADGSARRARPSGMATRSNSAFPSFQLATPVSPPPQTGIRADRSSPRRAATADLSHYQLTARTYQTPMHDKKPRPLTSTVRELLPDNFRYGFGCPLIGYIL